MTDIDGLPAWARRRLARHFERGGNVRILRWMSVPLRRGPGAIDAVSGGANASSDPFIAPPPRPDAATTFERPAPWSTADTTAKSYGAAEARRVSLQMGRSALMHPVQARANAVFHGGDDAAIKPEKRRSVAFYRSGDWFVERKPIKR